MLCLKKKKGSTSFYEFMTGCQLENWTEQLIILLIIGTEIRILEKMGQMIMKTVSITKHAIILNIHIHSHYCAQKVTRDYFLLGIERMRKCYGYM